MAVPPCSTATGEVTSQSCKFGPWFRLNTLRMLYGPKKMKKSKMQLKIGPMRDWANALGRDVITPAWAQIRLKLYPCYPRRLLQDMSAAALGKFCHKSIHVKILTNFSLMGKKISKSVFCEWSIVLRRGERMQVNVEKELSHTAEDTSMISALTYNLYRMANASLYLLNKFASYIEVHTSW